MKTFILPLMFLALLASAVVLRVEASKAAPAHEPAVGPVIATAPLPLLMRALDEMPYEEIAETLGIPVVTAKVKVHRARLKLMQTRQAWREIVPAAGAKP